jgi:vitamin B12 transporter
MSSRNPRRSVVGSCIAFAVAAPLASHAQSTAPRADEIVVTGSIVPIPKREVGTSVSVIDAQEIELRGYDTIADVLRTQPGIAVTNTGGAGKSTAVRVRGEEGYRTQVIIDGVKAADPTSPQVGPDLDSFLSTSDIQRVEVLRGPQGFIYGADAGGVINIITGRGEGPFGGHASVEGGSFGTERLNASVSGGGEQGDYYISGAHYATDGFNAETADTLLRDRDGADNTTLHTKLGLNLGEDWRLQLVARSIDASMQYDGCSDPVTFATLFDCVSTTDQTTYRLSADYRSAKATHSFGYSDIDIAHEDSSAGVRSFNSEGQLARFEYTGSYQPIDGQTLVYGIDLQDEKIEGDAADQRDQNAYYFEYEGELGKNVFLSAGARYDDNDDFGSHTSSRVSIAYLQDVGGGDSLKYRASYGTGFRAPSLYEIAYNLGPFSSPPAQGFALTPEQSKGYDLGVEYGRANGLHLEATVFDQKITDEIFFDLDTFSGYLQSRGESESRGVELGVNVPLAKRLELLANLTFNRTERTTNEQRLRRPKTFGNIGLQYNSDDKLRFLVNLRLARDAIDSGGFLQPDVALPDYDVLDVSMSYSISKVLEVFARIENALDEDYIESIGFNTGGRAGYAGIRVNF